MTPDTVFRVASISKSLTAWGVMHLAEQGQIDLDGPAERYLNRWPLAKSSFPTSAITVRRLLNHTAGLNAGLDTFRGPDQPAPTARDLLEAKPAQGGAALVRPAGDAFEYSVPGYSLLQMILEDRTGQSFGDYMRSAVLQPLGMTSSSFAWDPSLRARTATPYSDDGRPSAVTVPDDQAADSLFSTATDIARFIAAPLPDTRLPAGAHVISAGSVGQMFDRPVEIPSLQLAGLSADLPGLGVFVEKAPGQPDIVTNGGFDPGWSSRFYLVPGTGDGLAILTNSDRGQPVIAQIASIWSAWRGLPPSQMTRVYRVLGTDGVIAISLLAMLAASLGANFALEMKAFRRRRFAFSPRAALASLVECSLVACAIGVWVFAHHGVITMPILNVVGSIVIGGFAVVALARLAWPLTTNGRAAA
jgi:CubicO group peptidase (beta-lactamase class C family)